MKIAIASSGKDENALVSPISGRAEYYLIYEDKKLIKTVKNPFVMGGGGAGQGVAQMLANDNVELIVSGKFGEKMVNILESRGVKTKIENNKSVKEIIENI